LATVPAGWRVRSVTSGEHVLRVAFPPGARRTGAGKVIEILHPKQNPACESGSCLPNPAELVILGNPAVRGTGTVHSPSTEWRHHLRTCTVCRGAYKYSDCCPTGQAILSKEAAEMRGNPRRGNTILQCPLCGKEFTGGGPLGGHLRIEHGKAPGPYVKQAWAKWDAKIKREAENPIHMQVFFDPAIKKYTAAMYTEQFGNIYASGYTKKQAAQELRDRWRRIRASGSWRTNPGELEAAEELFSEFHGDDPSEILEEQRSSAIREDYAALGELLGVAPYVDDLKIPSPSHWDDGGYPVLKFEGVMLASNADGSQLYAIGGDQDLSGLLAQFSVDTSKDLVDLGEIAYVVYEARKSMDGHQLSQYQHEFDEPRPRLGFDQVKQEIFFVGGRYEVNAPGIEH
jgi:hypothetical protein